MSRWGYLVGAGAGLAAGLADFFAGGGFSAVALGLGAFSLVLALMWLISAAESLFAVGAVAGIDSRAMLRALVADREAARRALDGFALDRELGRLDPDDARTMAEPLQRRIEAIDHDLEQLESGHYDPWELALQLEVRQRTEQEASR